MGSCISIYRYEILEVIYYYNGDETNFYFHLKNGGTYNFFGTLGEEKLFVMRVVNFKVVNFTELKSIGSYSIERIKVND